MVTNVENNTVKRLFGQSAKVDELKSAHGPHILLYQIYPSLIANFHNIKVDNRIDGNYGLENDWTMQVIHIGKHTKPYYSSYTKFNAFTIPRIMWINKKWTFKQVHHEIFKYLRPVILKQYENAKDKNEHLPQIKKLSIDEAESEEVYSLEEFKSLTEEQQFNACFPSLNEQNWKEIGSKKDFKTD